MVRCADLGGHHGMQCPVAGLHTGSDIESLARAGIAGRPDKGVDHIVDEDVIASVGTVTEHRRRLAGQQGPRENGDHTGLAMWFLSWPVHVGGRDMRAVQSVEMPEAIEIGLGGQFGRAVRRCRISQCRLIGRIILRHAIDGAAR